MDNDKYAMNIALLINDRERRKNSSFWKKRRISPPEIFTKSAKVTLKKNRKNAWFLFIAMLMRVLQLYNCHHVAENRGNNVCKKTTYTTAKLSGKIKTSAPRSDRPIDTKHTVEYKGREILMVTLVGEEKSDLQSCY